MKTYEKSTIYRIYKFLIQFNIMILLNTILFFFIYLKRKVGNQKTLAF